MIVAQGSWKNKRTAEHLGGCEDVRCGGIMIISAVTILDCTLGLIARSTRCTIRKTCDLIYLIIDSLGCAAVYQG